MYTTPLPSVPLTLTSSFLKLQTLTANKHASKATVYTQFQCNMMHQKQQKLGKGVNTQQHSVLLSTVIFIWFDITAHILQKITLYVQKYAIPGHNVKKHLYCHHHDLKHIVSAAIPITSDAAWSYLSSQMLPEGHLQSSVSHQVEVMCPRDMDIHYASSATKTYVNLIWNYLPIIII